MAAPVANHSATNGHSGMTNGVWPSAERTAGPRELFASLVLDRLAPQIGAFDWYRQTFASQFQIASPLHFLNVGTGGGVETVRLLRKGNHVTTIEIDAETARRTRERIERSGFGDRHVGHVGHVLAASVQGPFDGVFMCEVLEHIREDFKTLQRLSDWLVPGGRLVLSTPTASWGQLPGDEVFAEEEGGHVRAGYDGPELDATLHDVDIIPLRRIFVGKQLARLQIRLERQLQASRLSRRSATASRSRAARSCRSSTRFPGSLSARSPSRSRGTASARRPVRRRIGSDPRPDCP